MVGLVVMEVQEALVREKEELVMGQVMEQDLEAQEDLDLDLGLADLG